MVRKPHATVRSRLAAFALCLALALQAASPASARSISLTRDAEIEALVADYARPLLKAAGLRANDIEIVLVADSSFNAFVLGRRLFINTGAFLVAETPNEIIAVLAHEIGHIAGGHQERLREQLERAKTQTVIAQLVGIGAAIAGAAANNSALAGAGQGIAMGGPEGIRRGLLAYKRTEETAADRAAIRYLEATGQSPVGLKRTLERFQANMAFASGVNPYLLSHPLPRDRLAAIDALVNASPNRSKQDSAALRLRHERARAKVAAYTAGPGSTDRLLRTGNDTARAYGAAIEAFLYGRPDEAVARIDTVIRALPNDPYVHEMKGEILLRTGEPARAVESFRRALRLNGDKSGIMRAEIGNALLATNDPTRFADAIANLRRAVIIDPSYTQGHRDMAKAFNRIGDTAAAHLATAEAFVIEGNTTQARVFATRAQGGFGRDEPGWRRAQDIIEARAN